MLYIPSRWSTTHWKSDLQVLHPVRSSPEFHNTMVGSGQPTSPGGWESPPFSQTIQLVTTIYCQHNILKWHQISLALEFKLIWTWFLEENHEKVWYWNEVVSTMAGRKTFKRKFKVHLKPELCEPSPVKSFMSWRNSQRRSLGKSASTACKHPGTGEFQGRARSLHVLAKESPSVQFPPWRLQNLA